MSDVTNILAAIDRGEPHAAERLLPLVYDELRRLATARMGARSRARRSARALVREPSLRQVVPADTGRWRTA